MVRLAIRLTTLAALGLALASACWWWWAADGTDTWLEPAATALALTAALTGIPAERWAAEAERRRHALIALRREFGQNKRILGDPRFRPENQGVGQVYPRLLLGTVDTVFISGALDVGRDEKFLEMLLDWRNLAQDLNRRLDVTELRLCTIDTIDHRELAYLRGIGQPGGYLAGVTARLEVCESCLEETLQGPTRRWWQARLQPVLRGQPGLQGPTLQGPTLQAQSFQGQAVPEAE
ncbi:hypothetical protein [Nonomuraea soli]|uniref:Uncharacterized protein n=1 Tax=Nonomuraea soli TaxID=1032476 RepID=A0A7W0HSN4_9ACTN|nr:hypothetical protein [Nonomuraea soli]MBA2894204.1 hypothetical protein [Nonomuraea soli]